MSIHTEDYKGYTIEIYQDQDPIDPRGLDNVATLALFHTNYILPNETDFADRDDFSTWAELRKLIEESEEAAIIAPVYMHDHGGTKLYIGEFVPDWDTCCVGFAFVTHEKLEEEAPRSENDKPLDWARSMIMIELDDYNRYANGDVYGYDVTDSKGETIANLSGINDLDEAIAEAKGEIDAYRPPVVPVRASAVHA